MAEREANLPVDFFEVGADDEQLTSQELGTLSLFEGLSKVPSFYKFPGSTVLRRCRPGQIMCRQGEAGASAFYILSAHDVVQLRRHQLQAFDLAAEATEASPLPARLQRLSAAERLTVQARYRRELEQFQERQAHFDAAPDQLAKDQLASVAKVKLLVSNQADQPRRGLLHRLSTWWQKRTADPSAPAFIPIDGMMSLDARTLESPLMEKEVFGEMSCLNRAPRSATVIVEQDCYMLEFLRNVLDMLYKDPQYKQKTDAIYRQRVLDKQVRQLSVFKSLSDQEFQELQPCLELIEFQAGNIIFDEHEDSDCLYLIRSGLVKVLKHSSALISPAERSQIHWSNLAHELLSGATAAGAAGTFTAGGLASKVWGALGSTAQTLLQQSTTTPLAEADQEVLVGELNHFIRQGKLATAFGDKRTAILAAIDHPTVTAVIADFPEKVKSWSDQRLRAYHRALLEVAAPHGLPRRELRPARTLNYLSKGEILGEIGLLNGQPRSASCVAFDQRDRGQEQSKEDLDASPSRVELVRLKRDDLAAVSPAFRKSLEAVKARRMERLKENEPIQRTSANQLQSQTIEFEELGLVQGQRLMLIDLEKCTRCGACVEACVDAHADGRNRLYLDGPRFDKYLVPITCRSCLDPVCLIGCPVGAIYRGDQGEIRIRNHCIGCSLCADQCPYGSIHMSERELTPDTATGVFQLESGVVLKEFTQRAVVCDLCSSHSSKTPSCVYACPHDAVMRVDARAHFGVAE